MTDEQLQAIRKRWNDCNQGQILSTVGNDGFIEWVAYVAADEQDLLAEVERLRAEVARAWAAAREANESALTISLEMAAALEIVEHVAHHGERSNYSCIFGGECDPLWNNAANDYDHAADCLVTKAHAILAQTPDSSSNSD